MIIIVMARKSIHGFKLYLNSLKIICVADSFLPKSFSVELWESDKFVLHF